jgi:tRNA modification GTPase
VGRTSALVIAVRTKVDVTPAGDAALARAKADAGAQTALAVSAETGAGLADLLGQIATLVSNGGAPLAADAPILTHERHRFAVARALDEVRSFHDDWQSGRVPVTIAAVHLREAVTTLEDLIGAIDVDDVLDELFRRFCVGK